MMVRAGGRSVSCPEARPFQCSQPAANASQARQQDSAPALGVRRGQAQFKSEL